MFKCSENLPMSASCTPLVFALCAVLSAMGGLLLMHSGQRGMTYIDRLYGAPMPGRLRPAADRQGD